jgi:hypothetical protein
VAVDRLDGDAAVVNRGCRVKVKPLWLGMKMEQKYSELTIFVFYIMNRFLT